MAAHKIRRGHNIPKRMVITALLLLVQIAFIVLVADFITKNVLWTYALFELMSIACVVYIVNKRGEQSYKIAWIILILCIPFAGWLFYLIFGGNRMLPHLKRRYSRFEQAAAPYLETQTQVLGELEEYGLLGAKQAKYLKNESGYPVYASTETEFFPSGETVFASILRDLETAQKYIFLEFFILAEGFMWDEIHKILAKKVQNGVEVRIMFDDFGSANRQYKSFVTDLRAEGVHVSVFNPIKPSSNIFLNNRNHRKIIVIDGKIAYTGGFNIADEYINKQQRFGHWLDCGIRLYGSAVKSFTVMFCNMWNFTSQKNAVEIKNYISDNFEDSLGTGFVAPYCDGPFDDHRAGEGIYLQMINSARKYVYIATPYLIIDNMMIDTLVRAAKSGVDVRIICPKHWDKWYVHPVTQYHYSELLEAGVRIYEYTPGFIHSKLFVVDDRFATVGTFNMDYRSFNFHFECGVWICNCRTVSDINKHLLETMDKSEEIILESWKKRPLRLRFKQTVLHLFAPFM